METIITTPKETYSSALRSKLENFRSTGRLYLHSDFPFYYTDGVRYAMNLFENEPVFVRMAMQAFALSAEQQLIKIRLCCVREDYCWIEYCSRDGNVIRKQRLYDRIPVAPKQAMCFYFIGRTLLLPPEF